MFADVAPIAHQTLQVLREMQQLFILFVVVERDDGDAVLELVAERVHCVVHDHDVFEPPVGLEYAQVLHVDAVTRPDAALSVESLREYLPFGVEQVQHHIRVGTVTGREHHHLEQFTRSLQAVQGVRTDVQARCGYFPVGELHFDDIVHFGSGDVLHTVHKRLVQVEDDGLGDPGLAERGQDYTVRADLGGRRGLQVTLHVLQGLQSLY